MHSCDNNRKTRETGEKKRKERVRETRRQEKKSDRRAVKHGMNTYKAVFADSCALSVCIKNLPSPATYKRGV